MSAQPYSLESTVKGTVGSHSLLTAQVSINRTPSSHNPRTCSCHISVRGDRLCLQTYPAPSPSPHPCSTLPKEKPPRCLRSHTMSWCSLSQYLPLSSATWPRRDHPRHVMHALCFLISGYGSCSSVVCPNSAVPCCMVVTFYHFRLSKVRASTLRY